MDQKKIIEALQKALAQGSGDLDDLENLLNRAQADITKEKARLKEEQEKAEAAKGEYVAALATRLLNGKITDEDCAYVLSAWGRINGLESEITAKDLRDTANTVLNVKQQSNTIMDELNKIMNDWNKILNDTKPKQEDKKTCKDCDDVIDNFLKSFGLR